MAEINKTQFVSTDPHISISKSKGIKIDWKDGHTSEYGCDIFAIIARAPCAAARTARFPRRRHRAIAISDVHSGAQNGECGAGG